MKENKLKPRRGIYLLPNLFTTAGIFAGFYAIVAALQGVFDLAAMAIFIAMLLDGLDGPIARLTNTESEFGAQYDSLSDMVSFGIAPALVVYSWGLAPLGKLGWIATFFFVAATAMRLARFNTQEDKCFFYGIPSPAAAGMIASIVWVIDLFNFELVSWLSWLIAGITVVVALLMVSNIRYYSPKQLDLKGKIPFLGLLVFLVLLVAIAWQPPIMLLILFSLYTLSGMVVTIYRWRLIHRLKRQRRQRPEKT